MSAAPLTNEQSCEAGRKSAQRGFMSVWEREAENMARPISDSKREMILSGNLVRAILTLAIPVMLNSFIQSMYNLTDTFWPGSDNTCFAFSEYTY